MRKKAARNAGMTLLEIMFAAGIVAMALAMLFGSLLSLTVVGQVNEGQMAASACMTTLMEEINTLPYESVKAYIPPTSLNGPGVSREVALAFVVPKENGTVEYPAIPYTGEDKNLPNPVEVRLTLTWKEENGQVFKMVTSTVKGR